MNFIDKIKQIHNGYKVTKVYVAGFLVWEDKRSLFLHNLKICGIPFLFCRKRSTPYKNCHIFQDIQQFIVYARQRVVSNGKKSILWIDHSLGGGTEAYSFNQFFELQNQYNIIRLQYFPIYGYFVFSLPNEVVGYVHVFDDMKAVVHSFDFSEVCVNSVVGWANALDMLEFVADLKKQFKMKVSFRGHDFQALCPSFNLLNCHQVFCNLSYPGGCEACIRKVCLGNCKTDDNILFSGFNNLKEWRDSWNRFFTDTLDELIVFSNSTKTLFLKMYPVLVKKIRIIPHKTPQLSKVDIRQHKRINIAMLGDMNPVAKGHDIIADMCAYCHHDSEVKLVVVGSYKKPPKNLVVTGRYTLAKLPKIIAKYEVDLVFIPSIWPETFSYTTSEAMNMGLPVACYAVSGGAERVSGYNKGLVLKKIDPIGNLSAMKNFVKKLRKGAM